MIAAVLNHREVGELQKDSRLVLMRPMKRMPPAWATDPQKIVGSWQSFCGNHPYQKCGHRSCACANRREFSVGPVSWTTKCPFGKLGEVRWVKEPWWIEPDGHVARYRADQDNTSVSWFHAITMPHVHHRLQVTVGSITIEGAPAKWNWVVELVLNKNLQD